MFKKKCPICGAKNSKERTVCIECGAPFGLEQVKRELPQVSTEAEAQVKTEVDKASKEKIEEAPEKRVKDEYRDTEKVLYKTKAKISVPNKESEEVECFITESNLVIEAEQPMKIPLNQIKMRLIKESNTMTLVYVDHLDKYRELSLEIPLGDATPFNEVLSKATDKAEGKQIVGRLINTIEEECPPNTALEKFFFGVENFFFGDKTRDDICTGLQRLGINARMVILDRPEEEREIGGRSSLGIIHVPDGPIRLIDVRKEHHGSGDSSRTYYYTDYVVPDPRLEPDSPGAQIKAVRVKTFPLFGRVVDLRWEGWDSDLGIIGRLNRDDQLKQPIMESCDVTITAISDYSCWIMSTQTRDVPSGELWNCYQTIACHLLGEWSTGHKLNIAPYFIAQRPIGDKVHNVCPRCGSSNINKAIKRMLKSRQEIEALGFKAEWYCLCFNCRCTWAEGEKQ